MIRSGSTVTRDFPGHVIATMRTKTEWQTASDSGGKSRPVRVGLAPEQGKGIEYEFDVLFEISPEHIVHVIKDRSGRFQDRTIDKPDEEFGKALAAWLSDAPPPAEDTDLVHKAKAAIASAETVEKLDQLRRLVGDRAREGKFHQATADQLVLDIHTRLEEIGTEVQTVS